MAKRFCWTAFDVADLLPQDWTADIKKVTTEAHFGNYPRTPFLSREAADVEYINRAGCVPMRSSKACPGFMSSTAASSSAWPSRPGGNQSRRQVIIATASC